MDLFTVTVYYSGRKPDVFKDATILTNTPVDLIFTTAEKGIPTYEFNKDVIAGVRIVKQAVV